MLKMAMKATNGSAFEFFTSQVQVEHFRTTFLI